MLGRCLQLHESLESCSHGVSFKWVSQGISVSWRFLGGGSLVGRFGLTSVVHTYE